MQASNMTRFIRYYTQHCHRRMSSIIINGSSSVVVVDKKSSSSSSVIKPPYFINQSSNVSLNSTRYMVTKTKTGGKLNRTISAIDLNEFDDVYEQARLKAIADIYNEHQQTQSLNEAKEWLQNVIDYNVGTGKRNRARICWLAYRQLCPSSESITQDKNLQIGILGYCLELMQSYFLIFDDIMDDSITRRGQICWYRKNGIGMIAINDGVMISSLIHLLLKQNLSTNPVYTHMVELFNEVTRYTSYGQCLDLLSIPSDGSKLDFSKFTTERYDTIVRYKTAYYTFSLPIRLAIYLAGIIDPNTHNEAEEILLQIGHFFQTQDDYLDCFGDSNITGKIGTDIEDGKCSWLCVQALKLANNDQQALLFQHYGVKSKESVQIVRNIYQQLCLEQVFAQYEHDKYKEICSRIDHIENKMLPKDLFHMVLTMIYKRKQ
ncbi:hypothetical protein DERF_014657 [Dermatophagoides farinae]|uniref:Farnesyl pyrophosphate synthase n=1 Tax=Dermatophagoides farinae TaxID=6954 RepID=A0A922L1H6_DERFA|nr:hypothetical protein DERF_014657 [Dermatophagoides farinae]